MAYAPQTGWDAPSICFIVCTSAIYTPVNDAIVRRANLW